MHQVETCRFEQLSPDEPFWRIGFVKADTTGTFARVLLRFNWKLAQQQRNGAGWRTTTQQKLYQSFVLNLRTRLILEHSDATYGDHQWPASRQRLLKKS